MKIEIDIAIIKVEKIYHLFEHKGRGMSLDLVTEVLNYAKGKGYKDTGQITDADIEFVKSKM